MKPVLLAFCSLALLTSCSTSPGLTPMEQDGLVTLDQPLNARVLFTMDSLAAPPPLLLPIFDEYRKTPLVLHIVWRTATPPQTSHLKQFPGRKIKQFWDPKLLTPSTNNQVRVNSQLIPFDRLQLRMALARAAIAID